MHSREDIGRIGRTICEQLGGLRFCVMTGTRYMGAQDDAEGRAAARFKLARNAISANRMRVVLDEASDTYEVEFSREIRKRDALGYINEVTEKLLKRTTGLFFDQLEEHFSATTGLDTRL